MGFDTNTLAYISGANKTKIIKLNFVWILLVLLQMHSAILHATWLRDCAREGEKSAYGHATAAYAI
jgi:hypothetical protein